MTSSVYMKDILQNSFVFFKPKDVVSGDFYWVHKTLDNIVYFTVADCTGHGVPGAFMSMIGNSLLNEVIIEDKIESPAEILDKLRELLIKSLRQQGGRQSLRKVWILHYVNWTLERKLLNTQVHLTLYFMSEKVS